jgi:uncharacterized membrane protein
MRGVTNIVTKKNGFDFSYCFCFYKFIVTDIDLDSWVFEPVVTPLLLTLPEHIFTRFSWTFLNVNDLLSQFVAM